MDANAQPTWTYSRRLSENKTCNTLGEREIPSLLDKEIPRKLRGFRLFIPRDVIKFTETSSEVSEGLIFERLSAGRRRAAPMEGFTASFNKSNRNSLGERITTSLLNGETPHCLRGFKLFIPRDVIKFTETSSEVSEGLIFERLSAGRRRAAPMDGYSASFNKLSRNSLGERITTSLLNGEIPHRLRG